MQNLDDPRYHIEVSVRSQYILEQSEPDRRHFVFAYTVTIQNKGLAAAQLLASPSSLH